MEIGGYIEMEHYHGQMFHQKAIALNCGRNALAYLCEAKHIRKLYLPYLLCDAVTGLCEKIRVEFEFYHIDQNLKPCFTKALGKDEWLYLVNYYGQLSNEEILQWKQRYGRIIVDHAQSFFQMPVEHVDTLYTCRKYFGVPDGAFLYTDTLLEQELETDESFDRMLFLMGRYERTASEFYGEFVENEENFSKVALKKMSRLTENILRSVNYRETEGRRRKNFAFLQQKLGVLNRLSLSQEQATFMYPLLIPNGDEVRKRLQEQNIYVPTLWPSVKKWCTQDMMEYQYAANILPLPCDQRYKMDDMEYIAKHILKIGEDKQKL